jgi:hypothetical protein
MENLVDRYKLEEEEQWRDWINKIPTIKFPKEWNIKIIPAFGGAMARFMVQVTDKASVSVYLDVYDRLGFFGSPYWEVYPVDDDCYRIPMNNTNELINIIKKSIRQLKKEK